MGFKRTSEGRVFFKGAAEASSSRADLSASSENEPAARISNDDILTPASSSVSQLQILALLKALNDKLKNSQSERGRILKEMDRYRTALEALEGEADQRAQDYQKLERKISTETPSSASTSALASASMAKIEARAQRAETLAQETMAELEKTRKLLQTLEGKTNHTDKGLSLLSAQMGQTKKIGTALTQKQARLEAHIQVTQDKYDSIEARVDDTVSQQERLIQKIDKAAQDQARYMRKIEGIEEAVLQTRDALTGRSSALLPAQKELETAPLSGERVTETKPHVSEPEFVYQGVGTKSKYAPEKPFEQNLEPNDQAPDPWWKSSIGLQVTGFVVLVIIGVGAGWFVSEMQRADLPEFSVAKILENAQSANSREETVAVSPRLDAARVPAETMLKAPIAPAAPLSPLWASLPEDDIGALDLRDEEAVLAALEGTPKAVAAALNNIEPGNPDVSEYVLAQAVAPVSAPAIESLPQAVAEAPVKAASYGLDPALPDVMKDIEAQAFADVPEAQHDLAAIYTAGHSGVTQDFARAAYWFEKAADQGISNARYNLGVLHHQGLGIPINMEKAIFWYKKAADLAHPEAQYNLGIAYIEGIGVEYSPQKAMIYFENAAQNGVVEAAYNLGLIYENGLLGEAQPDKALMWYKKAADQGSPEAKAALEQLAKTLGIKVSDVNRLVEKMLEKQAAKSAKMAPSISQPAVAPVVKPAVAPAPVKMAAPVTASVPAPQESVFISPAKANQGQGFLIAGIQAYLMEKGLYPGPADGSMGPLTRDAIRSYQALYNMDVNGKVSEHLYEHMQKQDEASRQNVNEP